MSLREMLEKKKDKILSKVRLIKGLKTLLTQERESKALEKKLLEITNKMSRISAATPTPANIEELQRLAKEAKEISGLYISREEEISRLTEELVGMIKKHAEEHDTRLLIKILADELGRKD